MFCFALLFDVIISSISMELIFKCSFVDVFCSKTIGLLIRQERVNKNQGAPELAQAS